MNAVAQQSSNELSDFDSLKGKIAVFIQPTSQIVVTDSASNAVALGTLKSLREFRREIEARRVAAVKPLRDKTSAINDYAKELTKPVDDAEAGIEAKMKTYSAQETKRIQEEQRKADEIRREEERVAAAARAKAEAEIKAKADEEARELRAKQEIERKAAAQKAADDAATLKLFGADPVAEKAKADAAAHALAQKQAEEKRQADAKAEQERIATQARFDREQKEKAETAKREAAALAASKPKNTRLDRKYEVTNPALVPDEFWLIDHTALGMAVRSGKVQEIPGVRMFLEETVVVR